MDNLAAIATERKITPSQILAMKPEELERLYASIEPVARRTALKKEIETLVEQNSSQKGEFKKWLTEDLYNQKNPILGTLKNILTFQWVKGAVARPTGSNALGEIARWAAILTTTYFTANAWLSSGGETANRVRSEVESMINYIRPTTNLTQPGSPATAPLGVSPAINSTPYTPTVPFSDPPAF